MHQPHAAIKPLLRAAPGAEDRSDEPGKVQAAEEDEEENVEPRTAVTSRRLEREVFLQGAQHEKLVRHLLPTALHPANQCAALFSRC